MHLCHKMVVTLLTSEIPTDSAISINLLPITTAAAALSEPDRERDHHELHITCVWVCVCVGGGGGGTGVHSSMVVGPEMSLYIERLNMH